MDCKVRVKMRMVVRFPEYKISGNDTLSGRRKASRQLKEGFHSGTKQEYKIFAKICGDHVNHVTGELAGYGQPLDNSVKEIIRELVIDFGRTDPREVHTHVHQVMKTKHPEMSSNNRRYFPTLQDVRNHVFLSLTNTRYNANDQDNVMGLINSWKEKSPNDYFYFHPASNKEDDQIQTLLFVHQSPFQRRLLNKYGNDVVLLDSTYKTSKYDLPLFFLVVPSNVGYFVVASFIIGREMRLLIQEALDIVKCWNSKWLPKSFMCDLDIREINAVETVFSDTTVFLCDFHREQAWDRWLNNTKNGAREFKNDILQELRAIARSDTETELEANIQVLKSNHVYESNHRFKNWIDKYWLDNKHSEYLKAWPVDSVSKWLFATNDDDDEDNEDQYSIKIEDVQKHMLEAYKRCWYIVRMEGLKSDLPWARRHSEFIYRKGSYLLYGFGEALFSPQAISTLDLNIQNQFPKKKNEKAIYSLHNTIPAMANKDGKMFLDEESGQSENYCKTVLLKEAMISIMQKITGKDYSQIDKELKETEARKLTLAAKLIMNCFIAKNLQGSQ